ncbi:30S ribosomal protein S2 [Candidatus Parcubacteria bacterium]|nr:MAG: 30S ribosomal protein S2 [Candidatus Parcubacteria bacterium]
MPKIPSLEDLLKAGVHFGHRTSKWHPKMQPYIFGEKEGVHIIDIEQTQSALEKALPAVEEMVAAGQEIVFVGTKPQAQRIIEKYALEAGVPYVSERWLGGTFTNFGEIQKLVKKFIDLRDKRDKGELKKYTKLEQLQFDRKIDELDEKIGGLVLLKKAPAMVYIVDVKHDKTALMEAKKKGITVVALADTNINPELIDYPIPANDDAVGSITLITKLIAEAAKVGKARAKNSANKAANK